MTVAFNAANLILYLFYMFKVLNIFVIDMILCAYFGSFQIWILTACRDIFSKMLIILCAYFVWLGLA